MKCYMPNSILSPCLRSLHSKNGKTEYVDGFFMNCSLLRFYPETPSQWHKGIALVSLFIIIFLRLWVAHLSVHSCGAGIIGKMISHKGFGHELTSWKHGGQHGRWLKKLDYWCEITYCILCHF